MNESSTTAPAAASTTLATIDDKVLAPLRASYPDVSMTAEVIEGRVVDGFSIEVHGYFGADLIAVNAPTGDGAVDLMLSELERARSQRQSYARPSLLGTQQEAHA